MNGTIYLITNILTNEKYVGQTRRPIEVRINQHINAALRGCDYALYRAMRKYGIENFQWNVIEEPNIDDLNVREQFWIQYYDSFKHGYNETVGGDGTSKLTSDEIDDIVDKYSAGVPTRQVCAQHNISPITMRRYAQKACIPNRGIVGHKVYCIDPNTGKIIHIFSSITEAADFIQPGIRGHIKEVCDGLLLTAGGYYWSDKLDVKEIGDKVTLPEGIGERMVIRSVYQYDLNHHFITEYPSLIAAARALGSPTKRKDISEACRGLKKRVDPHHYNGFLWYFD